MADIIVSDTLNVTLVDTGELVLISGPNRVNVESVLRQLVRMGATIVQGVQKSDAKWTASCRRPPLVQDEVQVERLGYRHFVRGRSLAGVLAKVTELEAEGATQEGSITRIDGVYIAVCHDAPRAGGSTSQH
jgi:hypothetical protein